MKGPEDRKDGAQLHQIETSPAHVLNLRRGMELMVLPDLAATVGGVGSCRVLRLKRKWMTVDDAGADAVDAGAERDAGVEVHDGGKEEQGGTGGDLCLRLRVTHSGTGRVPSVSA